jgi:hypothetical protein
MKLKRGIRPARGDSHKAEAGGSQEATEARRGHVAGRGRRSTGEGDFSRATVFLPRPTREVLAQHGVRHGMSLQEIVEEAMDEWMRRNGHPPFYPAGWSRQGKID